jgi:hypothetical protein
MGDSSDGQNTVVRLHVVQADYGDSLILEYGQAAAPRPNGRMRMVATNLTPNLKKIKRRIKKEKIPCELVVLTAGQHSIRL